MVSSQLEYIFLSSGLIGVSLCVPGNAFALETNPVNSKSNQDLTIASVTNDFHENTYSSRQTASTSDILPETIQHPTFSVPKTHQAELGNVSKLEIQKSLPDYHHTNLNSVFISQGGMDGVMVGTTSDIEVSINTPPRNLTGNSAQSLSRSQYSQQSLHSSDQSDDIRTNVPDGRLGQNNASRRIYESQREPGRIIEKYQTQIEYMEREIEALQLELGELGDKAETSANPTFSLIRENEEKLQKAEKIRKYQRAIKLLQTEIEKLRYQHNISLNNNQTQGSVNTAHIARLVRMDPPGSGGSDRDSESGE